MNLRPGHTRSSRIAGRGFSLVELLLAVALIGLLLGAIAFNFSTLQRGARLEEGASQLESLIRFARAHAASSGKKVVLTFDEDAGDGLLVPLGNVSLVWEPDPLGQPDQFQPLPEAATYIDSVLDLITIENVRPFTGTTVTGAFPVSNDPAAGESPAGPGTLSTLPAMGPGGAGETFGFAPITFYPDGSSDSAEITIAARSDEDEARRMVLRLAGLTGAIRRRVVMDEAPLVEAAPPGAKLDPKAEPKP